MLNELAAQILFFIVLTLIILGFCYAIWLMSGGGNDVSF